MTDQYAVIGNPIAHSKSPQIHTAFAKQTNQNISYEAILVGVAPNEFEEKIGQLIADGYKGLNVTVPFKFNALLFAAQQGTVNPIASRARAVNTLTFKNRDIIGDNTDGIGLVRDVEKNLNFKIAGKRVL
ncbi:MAG: shikimate dehydrogenase, partial [Methylophilaceae bacterium]